jgi:hypothetical protein
VTDQPVDEPALAGASGDAPPLAGASGDDISAGTSVSGVGGEALKMDDSEAGLPPVHEEGARIGWGKEAAEAGIEPTATNDGTGQSEKPPA